MKRKLLSVALGVGAFIGIGGGVASIHHRHHRHHDRMMRRVAQVCVEAARDVDQQPAVATPQIVTVPVYLPAPAR